VEHAPPIPLYDDSMPSGVSTILTSPGENVAPADPSKSRIMLVDGTSVMYRSYYKILGQCFPYAVLYWYILSLCLENHLLVRRWSCGCTVRLHPSGCLSWCSVPQAHLIVYVLCEVCRFILDFLQSRCVFNLVRLCSHVHLPFNRKKEIVSKHAFKLALLMAKEMLELNFDMEMLDLVLLWCGNTKYRRVLLLS
jgi:hypothetical protein